MTSIDLKKKMIKNLDPIRPVAFHNRTKQMLPKEENNLQLQVEKLNTFAEENEMQINYQKTKVMLFNSSKTNDFIPEIVGGNGDILEVEEEFKLLGVKVTNDMKWDKNTQFICAKAYSRLWMLRNLMKHGASTVDLIDVYEKQCRSVLEMAVPAWSPGLTKTNANQIERVQKTACAIMLGEKYTSYENALNVLEMETLSDRRSALCLGFAKKAYISEKFQLWFAEDGDNVTDFQLHDVKTRTKRFKKSPLPYMTEVLNEKFRN